ncbi:molybdenum cofactor guanylyltransferase MobA [Rhizobium sp. G21]|uniref:molybdenum cofactor guanylyltransferase MobA n=1 Tax=Rhizobium sp. G21 TaxID=2758439 RepID=UPI001602532F|nr:molybdenum cofactor guanylyltransferase MobA [Rhizobium sp. G21]MBB1250893.1 molybdenum cofactor guanylyltransferase [Rhizobium sp. G21]
MHKPSPRPGVILSGGRSSRMGRPKALLPFGAGRLIDHVAARLAPQVDGIVVNANDAAIDLTGALVVPDLSPDFQGPLAGLQSALAHVVEAHPDASHVAVVTVDSPFFPPDLFDRLAATLEGDDDVALAASGGRMHPVTGLWPTALLPALDAWLAAPPTLRVRAFLEGKVKQVVHFDPVPTAAGMIDPFFNINTPEDLSEALRHLGAASSEERA